MVAAGGGSVVFGRVGVGFFVFRGDGSVVAMGCGTVWPGPGKVSSYYAVAYGVLATMRALFAGHRAAGVALYLDIEVAVDMLNTPACRVVTAADVWDEIRHWARMWGEIFKVYWQRGHLERR